jgi:hypothetical protein
MVSPLEKNNSNKSGNLPLFSKENKTVVQNLTIIDAVA